MRKNLSDPKGFNAELDKASHNFPLRELFLNHKSKMLLVIFIDFLTAIGFFILVVFLVNYLKVFLKIPNYIALSINTFNMIVFMLFTFLGGALSDKFGRKVMITMPSVFFILASYPIFVLFQTGIMGAFLAQLIIAVVMGLFFGAIPATISEQFPVSVRFSGLSLSHNISMAIFGGSAPLIATHIIESTGDLSSPAWLLVIGAILTLIGAHYLPSRTRHKDLEEPLLAEYRN
jgi:MHS family proline/betaine transporter-like MFS transporter